MEQRFGLALKGTRSVPCGLFSRFGVTFLHSFFQVRTRGSIKRRPPSRRFRRSQSDCGELADFRAPESSQENGAQEENGDEVFPSQNKAPGSPPASEGAVGREGSTPGSHEKPPLRRTTSRTEKQEQKGQAAEEDPRPDKPAQEAQEKALEPVPASSTEAKSVCRSPTEASTAGEQTEETTQGKAETETAGPGEEEPRQKSQDKKPLQEEGAGEQETPQIPPGGAEAGLPPKEEKDKEKQDKGPILEPGCNPRTGQAQAETSSEVPETEVGGHACSAGEGWCHMPCSLQSHYRSAQGALTKAWGCDRLSLMVRDKRTSRGHVSHALSGFSLTRSSVHVWVWME